MLAIRPLLHGVKELVLYLQLEPPAT